MPYNIIVYVKKNPALSHEEFETYYEDKHMPFIKAETGNTFPNKHIRYYIQRTQPEDSSSATYSTLVPKMIFGKPEEVAFDALVYLEFDDEQGWKTYENKLATCEKSKEIFEDALKFMKLDNMVAVVLKDGRFMGR